MLNSEVTRNNYAGDDLTSVFSYTFKIFADSELKVIVRRISTGVETVLTKTTDYTVSGVGSSSGGSVTLVSAGQAWLTAGKLSVNYVISITRSAEYKQTVDIKNLGDFYPDVHETVFDKIFMRLQQLLDLGKRSVRMPESVSPSQFNAELPGEMYQAISSTIVTNPSGTGWVKGPNLSDITNAVTSAAAAAASAAAALASQNSASLSASNAATSETNALAAEVAAEAAQVAAEAAQAAAEAAVSNIETVPSVQGNRSSPIVIDPAVGITLLSDSKWTHKIYVQGDGGAVNITANPQIEAEVLDGARITVIGCDPTNTVLLEDGNGLKLNGPMLLTNGSVIELEWDGSVWLECSRNGL